MARLNTKEIADRLGVSYVVAAGLVKHLVAAGKATLVEKVKADSGLGKPTRVYEITDSASLDFSCKTVAPVAADVAEAA
jgi:predicted ArsR family transcriptional regulator